MLYFLKPDRFMSGNKTPRRILIPNLSRICNRQKVNESNSKWSKLKSFLSFQLYFERWTKIATNIQYDPLFPFLVNFVIFLKFFVFLIFFSKDGKFYFEWCTQFAINPFVFRFEIFFSTFFQNLGEYYFEPWTQPANM